MDLSGSLAFSTKQKDIVSVGAQCTEDLLLTDQPNDVVRQGSY
jgi:hypothetical protein